MSDGHKDIRVVVEHDGDIPRDVTYEMLPATVILAATPNGQELAARLAACLDVGLVSSCLQFAVGSDKNVLGIKATYGGKIYSTVACSGKRPHLFTFKPGSAGVGPVNKRRKAAVTELSSLSLKAGVTATRALAFISADPRAVDLSEADMIVGGGTWKKVIARNWNALFLPW